MKFESIELVKIVAKLTPWLAPLPSAYFVARSGIAYLALPYPIAIVIALIIEALGLTSIHTWLWLSDWNVRRRKTDPEAPAKYAIALNLVYLVATITLTILLEVAPSLATYAPALFPTLAIVGAFNLALISQQENRERIVQQERVDRKAERTNERHSIRSANQSEQSESRSKDRLEPAHSHTQTPPLLDTWGSMETKKLQSEPVSKLVREDALNLLLTCFENDPSASYSIVSKTVGRSKAWISGAVNELERTGRLRRTERGLEPV